MKPLISAKDAIFLNDSHKDLIFLDSTFHLPNLGRNAEKEYFLKHIPKARFFNVDKICDSKSNLPHMLPSEKVFCQAMSSMGIKNSDTIIVYDNSVFFSSSRAWWMLKVFGHNNVFIIDGGLNAWIKSGGLISNSVQSFTESLYKNLSYNLEMCENKKTILDNIGQRYNRLIIDARAEERFNGIVDEQRPGLRKGHIPTSKNLPINLIIDKKTMCLKSIEDLKQLFHNIGAEKNMPITTTCGSGITATGLAFVAYMLGFSDIKVYDGSWVEWGGSANTPVEKIY